MQSMVTVDISTQDTVHSSSAADVNPGERTSTRMRRISDHERDPWLGRVIDNRYRVIEIIGRGGMGMVYKVEHQRMGKIAAMKVLHTELDDDPEVVGRFHREAEVVSKLAHPNTVQVFDFGEADGSLYLIMEFIRGQNLSALLSRDGPMPFERAGPMFMQICAALIEAHGHGVIHRDLKPENVLATRTHRGRDFVKVLDFGLAKLNEREEVPEVTDKGLIVGTPYYMSPEQIRGDEVDHRTDIYSLGALMYRLLTGTHPFTAKTPMGVLTMHLTADLMKPSERVPKLELSGLLDDIIMCAMEKDREHRYENINAMLEALEQAYAELCAHSSALAIPGLSSSVTATSKSRAVGNLTLDESDEIDYGILSSVRLQRADLDGFERSLSRRRWVGLSLVPLSLIIVAAVLGYFLWFQKDGPKTAESEANNDIDSATLIAQGTTVTGYLGKRINKSRSDHDFYHVRHSGGLAIVSAQVSELPNINMELSLLAPTGQVLARADEDPIGHGESVRRYRVRGPFYVLVTEARKDNLAGLPTENVSDSYSLKVTVEQSSDDREIEPNESSSDAHALRPNAPVIGYLDRRADVDSYRFEGTAGSYTLTIDGAPQVPLTWQAGQELASSERKATIALTPGDVIRLARSDQKLPASQLLPGRDDAYTIRLSPAGSAPRPTSK